jgi:hypothetical protein
MPRNHRRLTAAVAPTRRRRPSRYRPVLQDLERRALLTTLLVPSQYPTIQAAVNQSNMDSGDTILVSPGTYSVHHVVITSPVTLISSGGAGSTFLTGDNTATSEEGSIEIQNTTGVVTIGNVNQGFTFENPVVRSYDSYISSLFVTGNSAPVIVQYNSFVGLNGAGNPFDVGVSTYRAQAGGSLFIQNDDFSKMWQAMLVEVPLGGASIQNDTFHDLVASNFGGSTYEPEGVFALTYGGAAGNVSGLTISGNNFNNFNGLPVTVSGGYSGQAASQFTNVAISNNAISAIGFAPNQFRAGIVIQNGADTAADEPNGGVQGATISGNTIAAAVPCSAGSKGIWVLGANNNMTIQNNFIRSLDRGITVQEQVTGAGFASGMTVKQNSFTGNTQSIENDSPNTINAAFNYWGTNNPLFVKAQANGGVNVTYNPWLGSGTDTDPVTPGFQPDLTNLETDQLSISGPDSVTKNTTYSLSLNNTNFPNGPEGFPLTTWTIDWGDGGAPQTFPGTSTLVTHTYTTAGNDNITATATDSAGNTFTVAKATDASGNLYKATDANGNLYPTPGAVPVTVTNFSTLLVTHFYQNPSGFAVRFNQPIDTSVVHLYTSNLPQYTNTLGPASATLVGNSTGAVVGSLVLDADGMGFTFVATGSPLAADTYTVDLYSSATNGIRTASGHNALDGNADGVPGGDYTTTFTVASGARSVSVPDFARGPGQSVVVPNATGTGLPVQISNSSGVQTVMLLIHYDPTRLTINTANPVTVDPDTPAGSQVAVSTSVPGLLVVCFRSPSALGAGVTNLVDLNATVPNNAPYTSKEAITVDEVSATDGSGNAVSVTGDNAVHVVGYLGDASGDGFFNAFDNSLIQRVILTQDTGFGAYKDADPRLVADINGDGFINAFDNSLVQRFILGQNPPQIPPIPNGVTLTQGADPLVYIPKGLTVAPGGSVSVPVNFLQTAGRPIDLGSFDLAIAYDPSAFTVKVRPGSLAAGDTFLWWADPSTGLIYISASRQGGPVSLPAGTSGTLAVLDLVALPGAKAGARSLNLLNSVYADGESRASRLEDGHLVLSPAPTNGADDPVDGSVVVAGPKQGGRTSPIAVGTGSGLLDRAIEAVYGNPDPLAVAPGDPSGVTAPPVVALPLSWLDPALPTQEAGARRVAGSKPPGSF